MCLRIKEKARIDDELARNQSLDLILGEVRSLSERAFV